MNPYRVLDTERWGRKDVFAFYRTFDNPSVSVTVPLNVHRLYLCAKEARQSFFLLCLYAILRAANEVPQLRQRIHGEQVVEFERMAVITPIMTPAEIFCHIWCETAPTFAAFAAMTAPLVAAAREGRSNMPENHGDDYMCASVVPWFHFSSVTYPEWFAGQTTPLLTLGKMVDGVVPVAVKVHHGLVDGLHLGRLFANLERSFADPDTLGLGF